MHNASPCPYRHQNQTGTLRFSQKLRNLQGDAKVESYEIVKNIPNLQDDGEVESYDIVKNTPNLQEDGKVGSYDIVKIYPICKMMAK